MNSKLQSISAFFAHKLSRVGKHIYMALLLFFICMMALAGFIFWQYGYLASIQEPDITVRTVTTKESELRGLIEKMKEKEMFRDTIFKKTLPDPFAKPEVIQP